MPPPNVTPPPAQQPAIQGIQQAPLALTTQPQQKSQEQTTTISQLQPTPACKTPPQVQQQQQPVQQQLQSTLNTSITDTNAEQTLTTTAIPATATTLTLTSSISTTTPSTATLTTTTPVRSAAVATTTASTIESIQPKIQPHYQTATTVVSQPSQPLALASAPTTPGPTALVIIPQQTNQTTISNAKAATISTKPAFLTTTTTGVTTAHVTLAAPTQSTPIQLQAPITTHLSNVAPVPVAAHQQSSTVNQSALVSRPPTTLPVVSITTTTTNVPNAKAEPNKYICCLLDNGIRCDRVAGNASFNARIQKIVGTKKMDFLLDPTVRHAYICEHHKAIITVAKKTANLTRDTKANARNHTANNNPNTLAPQLNSSYNDLRQQQLQHPVNLELMANQNRLANNHAGTLNNISVRQGTQLGYTHYQGPHSNQVGSMDVLMSGNFDGAGGDHVQPSSGGVEVDLQQLQSKTLHRYKRHFSIQGSGLNKMQLAESLKNHFRTLPVVEKEVITYFVYTVKCRRNRLDHNPKAD